jgi:hypothetical protein
VHGGDDIYKGRAFMLFRILAWSKQSYGVKVFSFIDPRTIKLTAKEARHRF